MYSWSPNLSHISLTNSFGKVFFQILAEIEMTRNENWLFGRHFERVQIFTFFSPWNMVVIHVFIPGGGTQYKSGYRDVPQTWVAKSGRQVHQWVLLFFSKTWYFDGSIFQNFLKFAPKWRKFGTLIGQLFKIFQNLRKMAQISAKNFDFWYMDGSLFLQNGYMDGWHFKNPSGTPLPRPKLSTPPGIYIYGVKIIRKFLWESGFLRGFHGTPLYALTEVQGTLCRVLKPA